MADTQATDVSPAEFVDVRLEDPSPSFLEKWWVNSTPRAVLRKLLGVAQTDYNLAESESAVLSNAAHQVEVIRALRSDVDRLCQYAVQTDQRLRYYEEHSESIRYLKQKYDLRQGLAEGNKDGKIHLLRAIS